MKLVIITCMEWLLLPSKFGTYNLKESVNCGSLQNLDSGLDYGLTALLNCLGSDQCLPQ